MKILRNCLFVAALAAAASAQAHYLWIEKSGGAPMLRFGEFAENERERSPGRLDEIAGPRATALSAGADKPVALRREADGFKFPQVEPGTGLIANEQGMSVRDWSGAGIGIVKPMFYARFYEPAVGAKLDVKAAMTLDIVPTSNPGEFQVWFKQQPVAKTAVTIYAPNGWSQEHRTDANGKVALTLPWQGQYVVEAILLERTTGEFEGKAYEAIRHRATLSFEQTSGPATFAPAAAPAH